jgi:hypothetical protein
MKTTLALLLCSTLAFGQAADAPLLPPEGRVMEVAAGEIVPFRATCLDEAQALRTAKRVAGAEAYAADLKKNTVLPTPAFIAIVAGGVVLGIAAGAAVAYAVKR